MIYYGIERKRPSEVGYLEWERMSDAQKCTYLHQKEVGVANIMSLFIEMERDFRFGAGLHSIWEDTEEEWPRAEPPKVERGSVWELFRDPRSAAYGFRDQLIHKRYAFTFEELVVAKSNFDRVRWERDKYRHENRTEEFQKKYSDVYMQEELRKKEILKLQEELAQKHALECLHGDDVICDHQYWLKTKNRLRVWRTVGIASSVGFVVSALMSFMHH